MQEENKSGMTEPTEEIKIKPNRHERRGFHAMQYKKFILPKLSKLPFPIKDFENLAALTPAQVSYLKGYMTRLNKEDTKNRVRITTILESKKHI